MRSSDLYCSYSKAHRQLLPLDIFYFLKEKRCDIRGINRIFSDSHTIAVLKSAPVYIYNLYFSMEEDGIVPSILS